MEITRNDDQSWLFTICLMEITRNDDQSW